MENLCNVCNKISTKTFSLSFKSLQLHSSLQMSATFCGFYQLKAEKWKQHSLHFWFKPLGFCCEPCQPNSSLSRFEAPLLLFVCVCVSRCVGVCVRFSLLSLGCWETQEINTQRCISAAKMGDWWMFSRSAGWVGQPWCLICALCRLQAAVSDEGEATGLSTLNLWTLQYSAICAPNKSSLSKALLKKKDGALDRNNFLYFWSCKNKRFHTSIGLLFWDAFQTSAWFLQWKNVLYY